MLRRVSGAGAAVTPTRIETMEVCDALYLGRGGRRITPTLSSAAVATTTTTATTTTAVATPRRQFFWSGPSGKDFLRHFAPSSAPTKVVSPLESLRPPAPPSASDARPFGSLNRTNSIRRYVNVNSAGASTSIADSKGDTTSYSASSSSPLAAATAAAPPRMELSRLLRRHHSGSLAISAPSSGQHGTRHEEGLPQQRQAAGNATVAKAQAAIAAATAAKRQANTTASLSASNASSAQPETATGGVGSPMHKSKAPVSEVKSASSCSSDARDHLQVYKERCTIGWSPEEFYGVVADVEHYSAFLPWCAGSEVHTTRRVRVPHGTRCLAASSNSAASPRLATGAEAAELELVDAIEMTTTLTIGFSFLKEQYTSRVTLYPGRKVVAALYEEEEADSEATLQNTNRASSKEVAPSCGSSSTPGTGCGDGLVLSFFKKAASTAGAVAKRSILQHLRCEWEFAPVEGKPQTVDVLFSVSFEFKNPMHRHLIMSNVVSLMTHSFERRCESLYGPPSTTKVSLPVLS
ncbi:Polyketide cyclase / dehydrase and lipid transport, putative [Leishmania shawi]|uniref:Polyketide cyclase / dehydrase and lipid transport n=1 Tax=Leishmania shawi TaxID=5680 RepID=A0ABR3EAU7_9TRYP